MSEVTSETVEQKAEKKYPAMRVIIQIAMPHPTKPEVDLLSTEEFYTLDEPKNIAPSKVMKVISGQLRTVVQKAREWKPKSSIIVPSSEIIT